MFCIRTERTVKRDLTVAHNGKLYQIEQAIRAQKVTVEERLDGTLHLTHHGQELRYRPIPKRPSAAPPPLP